MEAKEKALPMDSTDPILPTDSTEPTLPMQSTDPVDLIDRMDRRPRVGSLPRGMPGPGTTGQRQPYWVRSAASTRW